MKGLNMMRAMSAAAGPSVTVSAPSVLEAGADASAGPTAGGFICKVCKSFDTDKDKSFPDQNMWFMGGRTPCLCGHCNTSRRHYHPDESPAEYAKHCDAAPAEGGKENMYMLEVNHLLPEIIKKRQAGVQRFSASDYASFPPHPGRGDQDEQDLQADAHRAGR